MIIDSSALLAILKGEPERDRMTAAILKADGRSAPAPTILETSIVMEGQAGERGRTDLDELLNELDIFIEPFTKTQLDLARQAFRQFGKGRHQARLNFGDCIVYSLAKETGEPPLVKGDDFAQTDIVAASYPRRRAR